jgi:hypothetical protein
VAYCIVIELRKVLKQKRIIDAISYTDEVIATQLGRYEKHKLV